MTSRISRGVPEGGQFTAELRAEGDVVLGPSGDAWPSVSVQTVAWRTNPDLRGPNGARPSRADRELTEIEVQVPALIATLPVHLSPETHAVCEEAAHRVSQLEAHAEQLSGVGDLLVRTEAVASSKIEHIYAEMDELARASIGEEASHRARRTMAAASTIKKLTESCDNGSPLTLRAVLDAHRELLADDPLEKEWAGRVREQQNWIGGSDFSPRGAVHVPPPADHVGPLMDDLVVYANRGNVGAIAQAAVTHAQFEAIHPFTDGNGRLGRALIGAVLRRRGITVGTSVPVAAAMLSDVDVYFDELKNYRDGNVDSLVRYVASSSVASAEAATITADRIRVLPDQWRDLVRPRRGSSAASLIDGLVRNPVLDAERARAVTGSTPVRTYEALDRLVAAGVLQEITGSGRNRVWVAGDLMAEVADLESRVGLRARPSERWR